MSKMKDFLKKTKWATKANSLLKNFLMEVHLSYNTKKFHSINANKILPAKINLNPKRILWIGGNYDQDHSGFIQSLMKIASVVTYSQPNGKYGLIKQPARTRELIFDHIRIQHEKHILHLLDQEKIDLVMGQMWASTINPEMLSKIRERGIPVINIAMDDKLPYHWRSDDKNRRNGAIGLASSIDLTLNTTRAVVDWYQKLGSPCMYWPLAGNPDVFYPRPVKKYDVVFIGSKYGYRGELVESLIRAGVNVAAFGPGWPAGPCTASQSAEIFGSAKIVLGIGYIGHSRKIVTLKQRDFDALFTGALYITSRNPDLEEILIDGKHIIYYDDKKDMVTKVKYYLEHEKERVAIAENALREGMTRHTWDIRLRETFSQIGISVTMNQEIY